MLLKRCGVIGFERLFRQDFSKVPEGAASNVPSLPFPSGLGVTCASQDLPHRSPTASKP
jgi:hypothetical protein